MALISNRILAEDLARLDAHFGQAARFDGTTVLLTGAAGFLGFTFVHYLASLMERGRGPARVICLDTFLLGRPAWLDALAEKLPGIVVGQFDISTGRLEDVPGAAEAAYVIHMASIASPVFYRQYPLETIDANIWGLRRLLDFYRGSAALKGLLFFSSSEIYGDPAPDQIPTPESYRGNVSCVGPRACYDESKRFGETLCEVFAQRHGVPVRVARPFNNYGPGMALGDRRVPADFAKAVLAGEDIVILSSGAPTRTFCHVADAVAGYLKVLMHDAFDAFNIGVDKPEISVRELAEIYQRHAASLFGYTGRVQFKASPDKDYLTHNPERRCPDLTKARATLGYAPAVLVDEGIRRFLEYLWLEKK